MSRGRLSITTDLSSGSTLTTMIVSVSAVFRVSAESIPVSRMLIRSCLVGGVASGATL